MFNKQPKELLGIDIGTKQIKIVELERDKKKPILKNYALIMIKDADIRATEAETIAKILKQAMSRAKIKTKDAIMSLPAYSAFLVLVKMPDLPKTEEELDQLIHLEARKYIPVPIGEVSLGWTKFEKEILLIAVPKDIVNRYGQIAQKADLNLKALEAETFSLARSLGRDAKEQIAIIDSGARSTNVSFVENGKVKINRTLEEPNIEQIKRLISPTVKKIILTGGKTSQEIISSFDNYEIGNPWQNIIYPKELEKTLIELGPSFAVAVGLALRDFNG